MFTRKPDLDNIIVNRLKELFGDDFYSHEFQYDMLSLTVSKTLLMDIMGYLYEDSFFKYRFLTTLCGIHYPGTDKELGVVYHLHSFTHNHRIRIRAFTEIGDLHWPTATGLFPTANWMERETYDFFGIIFDGHPNLIRILNVDDMTDFPMRKNFPLEDQTREDKNDSMFGR
ncbi:MAG: NADH-quinone oxidoreductase subunit C [Bacteroidetes bacterium]|nr:NADH-quinone oxidoreductase subunit C [Bacteroidota bacterium]